MFFAHFSVAVVTAVSCWPASVAAEVSLVSQSARGRVLCAKEFALLGLMVGVSAKKFALRAQKGPQAAFYGVLGEFFRDNASRGAALGEFCLAQGQICLVLDEECLANGCCNQARSPRGDLYANGAAGMRGVVSRIVV